MPTSLPRPLAVTPNRLHLADGQPVTAESVASELENLGRERGHVQRAIMPHPDDLAREYGVLSVRFLLVCDALVRFGKHEDFCQSQRIETISRPDWDGKHLPCICGLDSAILLRAPAFGIGGR